MTALRAFLAIALSLLCFILVAALIFRTPPIVYTGVTREPSPPFSRNIINVVPGSPAYRAGLRSGDLVSCLSIRDKELLFPRFGFDAYAEGMVVRGCAMRSGEWRPFALRAESRPSVGLLYYNIQLRFCASRYTSFSWLPAFYSFWRGRRFSHGCSTFTVFRADRSTLQGRSVRCGRPGATSWSRPWNSF